MILGLIISYSMGGKNSEPAEGRLRFFKIGAFGSPKAAEMCRARSALGSKSSKMGFSAPQARFFLGYKGIFL